VQDGFIVNTNYSSTCTIESITPESEGLYLFLVENVYGRATTQTNIIINTDDINDEQQGKENFLDLFFIVLKIFLEFQEVLEESPIKKKHLDDDSHLQLNSPHHKRISMMHHMPVTDSLEYEDLTVHIPGGEIEDIIIRTDFAPSVPRLSSIDEQSKLYEQKTDEEFRTDVSSDTKDFYDSSSIDVEYHQSSKQSTSGDAGIQYTMDKQQQQSVS
jgi:hypothetical protein